jgi:hypothetical protein
MTHGATLESADVNSSRLPASSHASSAAVTSEPKTVSSAR